MFAQSILNNYAAQIETVSVQIQDLENQLNQLREQQKQLEAERQAMATLATAGESAINQAKQFLTLANRAGRDDLINAFWDEIDQIREARQAIAELPTPEPEPIEDETIETTAIEVESNGNGHHPEDTDTDLKTLLQGWHMADLRTLARERNLPTNGKKSELIQRLLETGLTHEELTN